MTEVKVTEPTPTATRLADPLPLGIGAFALTTFVLSMFNAEILDEAAEPTVFGLALAYGGITQFGAGIWEFARGNNFGATAFCSFGGYVGIATALVAWYASFAGVTNEAFGRKVIPMG